jgi:hypothetical protein
MTTYDVFRWSSCIALGLVMGCTQILGIEELRQRDGGTYDGRAPGQPDAGPGCVAGEVCDTGTPCELGETQCVSGERVCVAVGPAPASTECRPAAGACDVAERCDGTSTACPADVLLATGMECSVDGEAGTCTGLDADCVVGCVPGTPCSTGNACEDGELDCSTGEPQCLPVGIKAAGAVCRPAAGVCDEEETCDGISLSCPDNRFADSDTICRRTPEGVVHHCDVAEFCTGSDAACPDNVLKSAGEECRPAPMVANHCDVAEVCDGANVQCPQDIVKSTGTMCRNAPGAPTCDVADVCDGSSKECVDAVRPSGHVCLAGPGGVTCDADDKCNGSNKTCPTALHPAGHECRPAAGVCDVAETCNGSTATCPTDTKRPNGFDCFDDGSCFVYECVSGTCQINGDTCGPCHICSGGSFCEPDICEGGVPQ